MKPVSRLIDFLSDIQDAASRPELPRPHVPSLVLLASVIIFWLWFGLPGWIAFAWAMGAALWSATAMLAGPSQSDSTAARSGRTTNQTEADAILARIIGALPDPAAVATRDGTVLLANGQAQDTLALKPGRQISTVVRAPELAIAFSQAFTANALRVADFRSGTPIERRLSVRIFPEQSWEGREQRSLLIFQDRTAEAQLDQMRSDFVANASHELRTPLASLKGFIETLQGAAKDDPVVREKFLDIMQQEASRMSRLIDDLLSLSRVEMRAHVVPRDTVDVTAIVNEVADVLRPIATRGDQTIRVMRPDDSITAIGDHDDLVQVVQNIAQNAIKYGKRGGHVILSVTSDGPRARIEVSDDGIGIEKEHIPRLTERFYRVSAKHSRERGGTGLGLAIVKHIVNRHRGELVINSKPGNGTTVTITLPREAAL